MIILRKYKVMFSLLFLLALEVGCRRSAVEPTALSQEITLRHATHFTVEERGFGYLLTLYPDGKGGEGAMRYALTRGTEDSLPTDAVKISIPISRLATNSGSNFEFLRLLGEMDRLVAACDAKYVYSEAVRQRIDSGAVISLGDSYNINVETLLLAHPDLLLLSDLRDDPHANQIPVAYNFEWKESTALGRAEWVKFIALFFDEWDRADSIYAAVESRYMDLKQMTDTLSSRPKVFAAGCFGDTWYMTGGEGYMASMYQDAGGDYMLKEMAMPTFTCGTEWLLAHYSDGDYWMNCDATRLGDIDERLRGMKSFQMEHVYHFSKRMVPGEGYNVTDFYETAVAEPDVVLSDLISVFHPQLLPHHDTRYVGRCESLNGTSLNDNSLKIE